MTIEVQTRFLGITGKWKPLKPEDDPILLSIDNSDNSGIFLKAVDEDTVMLEKLRQIKKNQTKSNYAVLYRDQINQYRLEKKYFSFSSQKNSMETESRISSFIPFFEPKSYLYFLIHQKAYQRQLHTSHFPPKEQLDYFLPNLLLEQACH